MTDLNLVGYMHANSIAIETKLVYRTSVFGNHGKESVEAKVEVVRLSLPLVDIKVIEVTQSSDNFDLQVGTTYTNISVSDLYFN